VATDVDTLGAAAPDDDDEDDDEEDDDDEAKYGVKLGDEAAALAEPIGGATRGNLSDCGEPNDGICEAGRATATEACGAGLGGAVALELPP
jgi:hypothetical protein